MHTNTAVISSLVLVVVFRVFVVVRVFGGVFAPGSRVRVVDFLEAAHVDEHGVIDRRAGGGEDADHRERLLVDVAPFADPWTA